MTRAVIYARFSSAHQNEESIEAQVTECSSYAARKGYEIVKVYADEALSGTETTRRKSYNAMLADARRGLFDLVIFHKIDRNARNEIDYYRFKSALLGLGVRYEYAAQSIDSTPEGQFMEAVMIGQAAYYSRNLSKETKVKAIPFAKKSQFMGGKPPYGYAVDNKRYRIDETEAPAIRQIFQDCLEGKSYAQILDRLHAKGYRTRAGKLFVKNSLHDILRNPRYCGTYVYNKVIKMPNGKRNSHGTSAEMIVNKGSLPAIVSEETWSRVQQILNARKHSSGQFTAKHFYLLSGIMRCGVCGRTFIGVTNHVHGRDYRYYVCGSTRMHGHAEPCNNIKLRADDVEKKVLEAVLAALTKEDVDDIIDHALEIAAKDTANADALKTLNKQKEQLENQMNIFYKMVAAQGGFDELDMQQLKKYKTEMARIKSNISEQSMLPKLKMDKEKMTQKWQQMITVLKQNTDPELTRSVLQSLILSAIVKPQSLIISVSAAVISMMVPGTGIEPVRRSLSEGF